MYLFTLGSVSLVLWIFLSDIPDVENSLGELMCNESTYNMMLEDIPLDSGSNHSKCRHSIKELVKLTPDDFARNHSSVAKYFTTICNPEGCLAYAGRIVKNCLTKLKPLLSLACATNGVYQCWTVPSFYNDSTAQELCFSDGNDTYDNCSRACKDELLRISNSQGCCLSNVFNSTLFGSQLAQTVLSNDTVWDICEVERQSFCSVPELISNVTDPTETEALQSGQGVNSLTFLWPSPILLLCKDFW